MAPAVGRHGTINTPDDLFRPLINNGAILGDSPLENIELTGYVRGYGTLDNVINTGTDAPGLGAAEVFRSNVTYTGSLEIEIAGTIPGDLHDQVRHSGTASLGGTLTIQLTGNYEPDLGEFFDILTFTATTGRFDSIQGMSIAAGKVFSVEYTIDRVTLHVVQPVPVDYDSDTDVDQDDFAVFQRCISGEGNPADQSCAD